MRIFVDRIPDSDVATARKMLRALMDPVELSLLTAQPDDEMEDEERAAVERALAEPGPRTPHEEILREYRL